MARTPAGTSLYRLIAAGRRAHAAVLAPLRAHALTAGDDAVVLLLGEGPLTLAALAAGAGVPPELLAPRLARLAARGYLEPVEAGDAFVLSEPGRRLHTALAEAWTRENDALTGGLPKRRRKALRQALGRYLRRP